MTTKSLLPPITVEELRDEIAIREAANQKTADAANRDDWKTQHMVCQRTAQELRRLLTWIEMRGVK